MSKMRITFRLVLFFIFFAACSPLDRVSNRDMAAKYDPTRDVLQPQYIAYNVTDTSTRLFLKVSTDRILYQQNEHGLLTSNLRLSCRIYESYETNRFADSCSMVVVDVQSDDEVHSLIKYADFKTPAAKDYVLELLLTDYNRHYTQKSWLSISNHSLQSPVNYLLVNAADSIPIFSPYLSGATTFSILCRERINKELFVRYFNRSYPLAKPAFRYTDLQKFNYRSDATYKINLNNSNEFSLRETGMYHLQSDSNMLEGLTIYRFSDDYPRITQANELVGPLRYLTTSREYNKILASNDKKTAIDDFWLDIAGNKTKGRELIKIFYSRVEAANRYFTSYHEGWKTDRGLIFIIFGEPDVVYRSATNEDWSYSGTFEHGPVNFTFEKIKNPFTAEDYNLVRSSSYQEVWFLAVDEWRQGRQMDMDE